MSAIRNQLRVKGQPKQNIPGQFNDAIRPQTQGPQQAQEPQQAQAASGNKGLADDFGQPSQAKKPMRKKKAA